MTAWHEQMAQLLRLENDVTAAWNAFAQAAEAAFQAGYIIALPGTFRGALAISATAKALPAGEVSAPAPEPVAETVEDPAPALQADEGDETPPKRKRFGL